MAANTTPSGDRLSALPDAALSRVLSHLSSTDEAVRTSVLSRRWRRLPKSVPVVAIADPNVGNRCGFNTPPMCFDQKVTCALLSRDPAAPIRCFSLDAYHPTRSLLVQWVVTALTSGAMELHVKLRCQESSRLRLCPFIPYEDASPDFDEGDQGRYTRTYPQIFRCATLRRLSLSRWTLDLPPQHMSLGLETLALHRIMGSCDELQRLISSCSHLVNLTLQECPGVTHLTVPSPCLQSFAMVCCHNATRVVLESRRLRSLRYKGALLLPCNGSFFSVANHAALTALTIDICEDMEPKTPRDVAPVTELIAMCSNLSFLHLALRPAMAYYSNLFTGVLRRLPRLRHLELKGDLRSDQSVASVAALLQSTPNLEALSLFPLLPDPPKKNKYYFFDMDDEELRGDKDDKNLDYSGQVWVPKGLWTLPIRCLKYRLKRITLLGYRGRPFEKMLAKFLLSKAAALDELSVSIAPGLSKHKDQIARDLASWRFHRRTRVTFV